MKARRAFWGGIITWLTIRLLLDILHNYRPVFTLIPKHLLLHTATKCFGPTWYSSSHVLNSSYDLDFDNFSIPVTVSITGCWAFESVLWNNRHS